MEMPFVFGLGGGDGDGMINKSNIYIMGMPDIFCGGGGGGGK